MVDIGTNVGPRRGDDRALKFARCVVETGGAAFPPVRRTSPDRAGVEEPSSQNSCAPAGRAISPPRPSPAGMAALRGDSGEAEAGEDSRHFGVASVVGQASHGLVKLDQPGEVLPGLHPPGAGGNAKAL